MVLKLFKAELYVPAALIINNATFCIYWFCMIIYLNSVNKLILITVTGCVLFELRTEFLNKYYLDELRLQRVKMYSFHNQLDQQL
jgi:hypothetical protein